MSGLSPRGTAYERYVAQRDGGTPAPFAGDDEDFEPAYLGWELARCAPGLAPAEEQALAALASACIAALRAGSTRMPVDDERLSKALADLGAAHTFVAARSLVARVRAGDAGPLGVVMGRPGERKPLILDGAWLSTEKMRTLEERFCERIRARTGRAEGTDDRAVRKWVQAVAGAPRVLSEEQKGAVRAALSGRLTLVTGGPGTGKTTIVVALLRALHWGGTSMESVAVAAPTGKAAHRLEEAIASGVSSAPRDIGETGLAASVPGPQTLHRLLGWSPTLGRFARHENDRLPHAVVVVDEASMIDLVLMDRLVRALRDDAQLVLFGDADQLPSVDAGAVFRDLCTALGAVRLTKNLRVAADPAARRIVDAATAVNEGASAARLASTAPRVAPEAVAFEGVEHVDASFSTVADVFLERWWRTQVAASPDFERRSSRLYAEREGVVDAADREDLRALIDVHARSRILCATRLQGFPACAVAINEQLVARLGAEGSRGARRARLPSGTPVLVQRNDYERRLYNGDQGVVVRMDRGRGHGAELVAVFARGGGAFDVWPADEIPDLAPAFAMTVHKAQGSELDHVALVLPDADLPLLTRELVYTAVTRARRSVVLLGKSDLLARAVSRTVERHSGIAELLVSR